MFNGSTAPLSRKITLNTETKSDIGASIHPTGRQIKLATREERNTRNFRTLLTYYPKHFGEVGTKKKVKQDIRKHSSTTESGLYISRSRGEKIKIHARHEVHRGVETVPFKNSAQKGLLGAILPKMRARKARGQTQGSEKPMLLKDKNRKKLLNTRASQHS